EHTLRRCGLCAYVLRKGGEGLWPIKLNPPDRRGNRWNTSAQTVLHTAESGKWVRIISKGEYRYSISKKTMEETPPRFSERSFKELVNEAFPPDRVIKTLDHPIWDELAHGSVK